MLYRIVAPYFVAGIIIIKDNVVQTAPIVHYMRDWNLARVRSYCRQKQWEIEPVTTVAKTA